MDFSIWASDVNTKNVNFPTIYIMTEVYIDAIQTNIPLSISLMLSFNAFVLATSTMMPPKAVICPAQTGWVRSRCPLNPHLRRTSLHRGRSTLSTFYPRHVPFSTSVTLSLTQQYPPATFNRIKDTAIVWKHPMLVRRCYYIFPCSNSQTATQRKIFGRLLWRTVKLNVVLTRLPWGWYGSFAGAQIVLLDIETPKETGRLLTTSS